MMLIFVFTGSPKINEKENIGPEKKTLDTEKGEVQVASLDFDSNI